MKTEQIKKSVVIEAIGVARRSVAIAFAASAIVAVLLIAERLHFESSIMQATGERRRAIILSDQIVLADERLTMSANMAATTGETQWIERYEQNIPLIDRAIAEARAMAPPEIGEQLDSETRVANDLLVIMERKAIDLGQRGEFQKARAILDSADYAAQKKILAEGSDRFSSVLLRSVDRKLDAVRAQAQGLVIAVLLVSTFGFGWLWQSLARSLKRSRMEHLDTERQIQKLAMFDALTGLSNRRHFHSELEGLLSSSAASGRKTAVIMIDLDRFKPVNDRFGHLVGDRVLNELGRLLRMQLCHGEISGRLGGDEFIIAAPIGEADLAQLYANIERIVKVLSVPVTVSDLTVQVGATAGLAICPDHGVEAEELMRKADVALYRAKRERRGTVRFFEASMDEEVRSRASAEAELRQAIIEGQIIPYFQPIINLATDEIEGFEALARWQHPERGILGPDNFITTAEDFGLIDELTLSMVRQACGAARTWLHKVRLAINISPSQLERMNFVEQLIGAAAETGFPLSSLEIEITETALFNDLEHAAHAVLMLKSKGIQISLDDFGTGYSSLRHLRALPFDRIKIDGSFVKAMKSDVEAETIVKAILALGQSLNLPMVAEWVEDAETAEILRAAGCGAGQGWFFHKPLSALNAWRLLHTAPEQRPWKKPVEAAAHANAL